MRVDRSRKRDEELDVNSDSLRVYESILGLLCSVDNPTPLVRLTRVVPFQHTQVYAKLEWFNPFGSVKDRVASSMVGDAEERGVIGREQKLVEPTSGNTGLALAMIANTKGYFLTTPISNEVPQEKRTMLRFFGAEVLELEDALCPAPWAPEGAIATATEIAEQPEFQMLNQYGNDANPKAHYQSTGPEIWRQTEGRVTHFVAGLGTCGTIMGTGQFLKKQNPEVQVLGVHPNEGHDIPGVRSISQLKQTRFFRPEQYDGLAEVQNQDAFDLCLRLNREESITAGPSSAMALEGAFKLIADEPGNLVVVIFPDSAFKYASSVVKHLAGLDSAQATPPSQRERMLDRIVENVRANVALTIDTEDAYELMKDHKPFVVDVGHYAEYCEHHIPGAVSMPLEKLPELVSGLPRNLDTPILSVCRRGNASLLGVLFLISLGYRNARSLTGGIVAWREQGFATETTSGAFR